MTEDHYPGVFDRFKAIAADGALVIVLMFAAAYVFRFSKLYLIMPASLHLS